MNTSLELGILGIGDDATPGGHLRVKNIRGDLVKVPFRANHYISQITGSASIGVNQSVAPENGDASDSCLFVTVNAGLNNGAILKFWFYGTIVGLRWWPQYVGDIDFGVLIDGMPYDILDSDREGNTPMLAETQYYAFNNSERLEILAQDLPDGKHQAEIHFPSNLASGAANTAWLLWGFLAERRAGYTDFPRLLDPPSAKTVLTTSAVAVAAEYNNTQNLYRYLRSILYTNTSGSVVTVTLQNSSGIIWQTVLAAQGSAGCSDVFDPRGRLSYNSLLAHYASAGSAVNATVMGGY